MPRFELASVIATFAFVAACGGSDPCEAIYEKEMQCSPSKSKAKMSKEAFVAACKAARSDPEVAKEIAAEGACASKSTCEEVKACKSAARAKEKAGEVTAALKDGKFKDAFDDCTYGVDEGIAPELAAACKPVFEAAAKATGEDLTEVSNRCKYNEEAVKASAEFAAVCKGIAGTMLTAATAEAVKSRDSGEGEYKRCIELKSAAEQVGGDEVAKAAALCEELDLAAKAKKGVDEARANAAARKTDLPYQCSSTSDELAKLGTPWAKQTLEGLLTACYVELGKVIIEVTSADAKYACPYQIDRVKKAAETHGLAARHPELATALAGLPATCTKS